MKDYSYGEIARMQMKALEDAREMNSRSSFPNEKEEAPRDHASECENCQNKNCDKNPSYRKKSNFSDMDDDKMLLLALMLILFKDCAEKKVLLALIYILM